MNNEQREELIQLIENPIEFSKELIRIGYFISDGKYLYMFMEDEGYYSKLLSKQTEIDAIHSLVTPHLLKEGIVRTILYYLKSNLEIRIKDGEFNREGHRYINCQNGVLDIETMKLLNHNSKYMFNYCNYANFIQGGVKAEAFESYCTTSLERDKEKRQMFLEMIGYTFAPTNKAKKACFILGPKHCGKSTIQNVIISILGRENVGSIALQDLSNRFSNSMLSDVRVNMQFELSNNVMRRAVLQ